MAPRMELPIVTNREQIEAFCQRRYVNTLAFVGSASARSSDAGSICGHFAT